MIDMAAMERDVEQQFRARGFTDVDIDRMKSDFIGSYIFKAIAAAAAEQRVPIGDILDRINIKSYIQP